MSEPHRERALTSFILSSVDLESSGLGRFLRFFFRFLFFLALRSAFCLGLAARAALNWSSHSFAILQICFTVAVGITLRMAVGAPLSSSDSSQSLSAEIL